MHKPDQVDFNQRPFVAIWETTRACDLACVHCRAAAQSRRSQFELTTAEGCKLVDDIAELLSRYENIVMWSVFFLVPTGRAKNEDMIEPEEVETLFGVLHETSKNVKFNVRTTEAMHYRRYVLQKMMASRGKSPAELIDPKTGLIDGSTVFMNNMPLGVQAQPGGVTRAPRGVNEAK